MSTASNSDLNRQLVKTVGTLIIVKMFIAIFTNKLSQSLTKRYVD